MHEPYKVWRAETDRALHADFRRTQAASAVDRSKDAPANTVYSAAWRGQLDTLQHKIEAHHSQIINQPCRTAWIRDAHLCLAILSHPPIESIEYRSLTAVVLMIVFCRRGEARALILTPVRLCVAGGPKPRHTAGERVGCEARLSQMCNQNGLQATSERGVEILCLLTDPGTFWARGKHGANPF